MSFIIDSGRYDGNIKFLPKFSRYCEKARIFTLLSSIYGIHNPMILAFIKQKKLLIFLNKKALLTHII